MTKAHRRTDRQPEIKAPKKRVTIQTYLKKHSQWENSNALEPIETLKIKAVMVIALKGSPRLIDSILALAGIRADEDQPRFINLGGEVKR